MKYLQKILLLVFLSVLSSLCFAQIKPMGFTKKVVWSSDQAYYPKLKMLEDTLYVCSNTGIYKKDMATDSEWELYAFKDVPIIEFVKTNDKLLAISIGAQNMRDSLILLSNDNGKTYIDYTSSHFLVNDKNKMFRIAQNSKNKNSLLILDAYNGVSKSCDFGENFEYLNEVSLRTVNCFIGFHPLDTTMIFYSGETDFLAGILFKSSDDGFTWSNYIIPNKDNAIHHIDFHPTNPEILVFGGEGVIGKSSDKGKSWKITDFWDTNFGLYVYKILFDKDNPNVLYASGTHGDRIKNDTIFVYCSKDMGESWFLTYKEYLGKDCGGVIDMVKYKNKLIFYTRECGLFELDLETTPSSNPIITIAPELTVYPNPIRNILHFETDEVINHLNIMDITGRLVQQTNIERNTNQVDVSCLRNGIYLATFYTIDRRKVTKKIQITH